MAAVTNLPLAKLTPDPNQPRKAFDEKAIAALADNIKARGIQQPLLVRRDGKKLVIKDGERRWRAAKLAKLKTVPVIEVKDNDTVQTRLDQVAVNNLREPLKAMDFARLVADLRDTHKLSANEIAARLEKDGIPYQGKKQLADVMRLTELPAWAQRMIDAGTLEVTAAKPIFVALGDADVLKEAAERIGEVIRWGGRAPVHDVEEVIAEAYARSGPDLNRTHDYLANPVLFNPATACRNCDHLRVVGSGWYCRNKAHYDVLQAQAKEAGLLPGGRKPKASQKESTVAVEAEEARAERKAVSSRQRVAEYFIAWLRQEIIDRHLPGNPELWGILVRYLAAGMPIGVRYGQQRQNPLVGAGGLHQNLPQRLGLTTLRQFLDEPIERFQKAVVATTVVQMLGDAELLELAHWLRIDLAARYRVDAAYLALKRKPELLAIAKIGGLELPASTKAGDIAGKILGDEAVVNQIGVPPEIMEIYTAKPEPEDEDDGFASAGDLRCAACGCTESEACEDGCEWIRTDVEAGVGLCSNCEQHEDAWDDGQRGNFGAAALDDDDVEAAA